MPESGISQDFWFNNFCSVQCFVVGLVRLDFHHLHLHLSSRFIKWSFLYSNDVFKSLFLQYKQSLELNSLCNLKRTQSTDNLTVLSNLKSMRHLRQVTKVTSLSLLIFFVFSYDIACVRNYFVYSHCFLYLIILCSGFVIMYFVLMTNIHIYIYIYIYIY